MPSAANSPERAYDQITTIVGNIKSRSTRMSADIVAVLNVEGRDVLNLYESLGAYRAKLITLAATPNLNAYVKTIYSDNAADLVADWNAFKTQLDAFIVLIDANYPKSSGYWNVVTTAAGVPTWVLLRNLLTAPQLTGLRTQLDALATAANAIA